MTFPTKALISLAAVAAIAPWCPGQPKPPAKPALAATPPMGWNSWEAFRKDFNEDSIKAEADAMVQLGFRDAGYVYVVLDGGWKKGERDAGGNLVVDPQKFPHGMQALADYVHDRGLKLGLHQPAGVKDCGHDQPGSQGHEELDAAQFASWGVDFIKYDQCDYIHDPNTTPGAPDLDQVVIRKDQRVVFTAEAEAPQNHLKGMARADLCPRCSGGKSVTGIGYANGGVEVGAKVSAAGSYNLDIHFAYPYYGQNRDRFKQMTLFVTVNGRAPQRVDIPYDLAKRYTTGTATIAVELNNGNNVILLDNPRSQEDDVRVSYLKMGTALRNSGRQIIFSTSGAPRPWFWAQPVAHLWRTSTDINNRWSTIMSTLDRHVDTVRFAGPDFWADPDMLEAGAPPAVARAGAGPSPTTVIEQRAQFSLWAIMNAPLFISADLRHIDDQVKSILLNREIIGIDQDVLAAPGKRIRDDGQMQVFSKRLKDGLAVALLNRGEASTEARLSPAELSLAKRNLEIRDLWTGQSQHVTDGIIKYTVEPHSVTMLRIR